MTIYPNADILKGILHTYSSVHSAVHMSLAIPFFKFPSKMKKRDMCMHVFGIMDFFMFSWRWNRAL